MYGGIIISELEELIQDADNAVETAKKKIENIQLVISNLQETLIAAFRQAARTFDSTVDPESLENFIEQFIKKPYFTIPMSEREWWLVVPSYITLEFGYLLAQDGPWNIFVVNQYSDMIQEIPDEFKEEIALSRPFGDMEIKADQLILQDSNDDIKKVHEVFKEFLGPIKDSRRALIQKGKEFELMAALIRQGILPFKVNSVKKKHLHEETRTRFELREYQQRDYEIFQKTGAVGIFYPMGGGKSMPALQAIADLKGKKLILVPNGTVAANWKSYLLEFTTISVDQISIDFSKTNLQKALEKEVHILIYHHDNIKKVKDVEYICGIFDEAPMMITQHRIEFAQMNILYRMTLTATPFREDGNEDLIFALAVHPLGVDWRYFIENKLIQTPKIVIWIEPDEASKRFRLQDILDPEKKTLVYCDGKKLGYEIANQLDVPFVSGDIKNPEERLKIIQDNLWVIVSRVADMGISIKNVQHIIEIDFLFGSRHQETQRVGRLFHSEEEGEYHALVTVIEYMKFKGRFLELYRQGLKIEIKRSKELPFDLSELGVTIPTKPRRTTGKKREKSILKSKVVPGIITETTKDYPIFDERTKLNEDLVLAILRSEYTKKKRMLSQTNIREIIDFNNIKHEGQQLKNLIAHMFGDKKISGRTVGRKRQYFLNESNLQGGE